MPRPAMRAQCVSCGRFINWKEYDFYIPFGSSMDLEPPDEVFLCPVCARLDEEVQVARGDVWHNWINSKSTKNAAKRLGLRYAGPVNAAWGEYRATLPKGWEWRDA
jgi:hypothetical protein